MTRKLAVTVFAMSLALVGCGSSSTTKVDGGKDAKVSPPPDAGAKLDAANLAPDTATPGDAGAADVLVVADASPGTDVVPPVADGGTDTTSVPPDTAPVKLDGGTDAQILPPDAKTPVSDGGPDATAKDGVTIPDVPADGNLDVPASGLDAPPSVSADAAADAGDVLVVLATDASEDASVAPDAAAPVDVVTAVDTIVADVGDDSASTAADSGSSDATATD